MSSTVRAAPPPSHQEVTRKLSVHSVAKPAKKPTLSTSAPAVSGTESDTDSVFSPDVSSPPPLSAVSLTGAMVSGSSTHPPLTSIAERRSGSGEESEEDEEDEEGGWMGSRTARDHETYDMTVLKSGYLWKKGERRKTWKKRWFVLRPAHLAFYKTNAEYKLLRLLDLSEIHSCTPVMLKKHANTFGLVSPTRTFYLQADSPHGVQEWTKGINEARQALAATSTQNSGTMPIPIPTSPTQRGPPPIAISASPSSHSPHNHNHHLTSSESEDASPSGPRSFPKTAVTPQTQHFDVASPTKVSGPVKDTTKVILSGYLMKCGSRRHIWHNRWFTLSGEKLMYCRSHMDQKHLRQIPLAQILDALEYDLPAHRHNHPSTTSPPVSPPRASSSADGSGKAGSHAFKIVTTKRTLLLSAPSEEEEIKWLSAVRALIARRSGAGVVPGDSSATPHPFPKSPSVAIGGGSGIPGNTGDNSHAGSGGVGGSGSAGTGTNSGGTVMQRRRDSIARRLSLSGGSGGAGGSSAGANNGGGGGGFATSASAATQEGGVSERQS